MASEINSHRSDQRMQRWKFEIPPKKNKIDILPDVILLIIFSYLPVEKLHDVSRVCTRWERVASDPLFMPMEAYLKVMHPELKVRFIGKLFWEKHYQHFHLSCDDIPFSNRAKIIQSTKKMLAEVPVEDDAGITLILEPKGFSIPLFREGCKKLNHGKDLFEFFCNTVFKLVDKDPLEKPRLMGLSTGVVKWTRGVTLHWQLDLLKKLKCEVPGVSTLSLLAIATFLESQDEGNPIRLFGGPPDRLTFSHSIESQQILGRIWHACVGRFVSEGLNVVDFSCQPYYYFGLKYIGIAALREFEI